MRQENRLLVSSPFFPYREVKSYRPFLSCPTVLKLHVGSIVLYLGEKMIALFSVAEYAPLGNGEREASMNNQRRASTTNSKQDTAKGSRLSPGLSGSFSIVAAVYLICYAIRLFEVLVLRTDQGILGEAFIQKVAGIIILVLVARLSGFKLREIGFAKKHALRRVLLGLGIGLAVFVVAYSVEFMVLTSQGQSPTLEFYVSAYALAGSITGSTTVFTIALCIVFNLINVLMEEGLFRGLFTRLGMRRVPFMTSNIIASLLFGLWHIALPIRSFIDGDMSAMGAFAYSSLLVSTSFLMGFLLGMLTRMTGGIWASMGVHFVNNTIINLLHVSSLGGADELQMLRLTISQALAFSSVLIAYIIWYRKQKQCFVSPV